jgi:hypothetical protein
MRSLSSKLLAPVLAVVLATGLFVQMQSYAVQDDTSEYHAAIREAAERIPLRLGDWAGADTPIPPAAGKLLRPNVLFSRHYRNEVMKASANLVLVQCLDARDMSGHYPPNCYRGNGWTLQESTRELTMPMWGREIPVVEYHFTRSDGSRTHRAIIYNFFVLPTAGLVTSMEQVQEASGDFRARPYGAAQVQVMMDAGIPERERLQIVSELLEPLGPVVELLDNKEYLGGEDS